MPTSSSPRRTAPYSNDRRVPASNYKDKRDVSWFDPLDPANPSSIVDRVFFTDSAKLDFKIAVENKNAGMPALKSKFCQALPITEIGGKRPYQIADSFLRSSKKDSQREGWYYIDEEAYMLFVIVPSDREGQAIFVCPLILKISQDPDPKTLSDIKAMAKGIRSFSIKDFDNDIHGGHV